MNRIGIGTERKPVEPATSTLPDSSFGVNFIHVFILFVFFFFQYFPAGFGFNGFLNAN